LVKDRQYQTILLLCGIYAGAVLLQGATKLAVNMYRSWIGECAIRKLRRRIRALGASSAVAGTAPEASGVEVSMIVAEVEPVGGFVGEIISEPLAHGGTLLSTFAYLLHLDAWMTLAASAIFVPQFVFVPLLQRAINRRTARRVQLLREVSASVVGAGDRGAEAADEARIARVFRLNMGIYWLKYSMNFLMNFGNHLQVVIGLLLGGWLVLQGHLAVGSVVAFISGIAKVKDPWDELVDYFRNMAVTMLKFRMVADAANAIAHDELPVAPKGELNAGRGNREGRAAAPDR
jgi:ABC-type multidrug transport system fused ATPase/permease subunit